jgi:ADP-glucose pyrophosphorylase
VQIVRRQGCAGLPIRTLSGYLDGLKAYYQRHAPGRQASPPADQEWRATFGLIEPGARVHRTAVVHDSVVLAGGVIEAGAVVVRSVVGAKGYVAANESIIDSLVGPRMTTAET